MRILVLFGIMGLFSPFEIEAKMDSFFSTYQLCMENNKKIGVESKDCEGKLFQQVKQLDFDDLWSSSIRVRREIGNLNSLRFFVEALSKKTSQEHCIDRDLETAILAGLNWPQESSQFVQLSQRVAFQLCQEETVDLVMQKMSGNPNPAFIKNVCAGASNELQSALDQC